MKQPLTNSQVWTEILHALSDRQKEMSKKARNAEYEASKASTEKDKNFWLDEKKYWTTAMLNAIEASNHVLENWI